MELEIKHLAAYLPYVIKIKYLGGLDDDNNRTDEASHLKIGDIGNLVAIDNQYTIGVYWMKTQKGTIGLSLNDISLILRPLSDLTKEIEVNGENITPSIKLSLHDVVFDSGCNLRNRLGYIFDVKKLDYTKVQSLIEWHFDIFGLIENGLAIDINTI